MEQRQLINILLFEDSDDDVLFIKRILENETFIIRVYPCSNEIQLKQYQVKLSPDVILSEYFLDHFDGVFLLNYCRKTYPKVPFIFVTDLKSIKWLKDTALSLADAYIGKSNLSDLPILLKQFRFNQTKRNTILNQGRNLIAIKAYMNEINREK